MKEEEERKNKILRKPAKLPRVALLSKQPKDSEEDIQETKESQSPIYQEMKEEPYKDEPYYYIDRAVIHLN